MSFQDFSFSSGLFVQLSRTVNANLTEGIIRNISVKLF